MQGGRMFNSLGMRLKKTVACRSDYWFGLNKDSDWIITITIVALAKKGEIVNFEPIYETGTRFSFIDN